MRFDGEVAKHLSALIGRLYWLEQQDAERGEVPARSYERRALEFVLDEFANEYPAEMEQAEQWAQEREARRRNR